jgi:SAM-dependent methyltransferase
MFSASAELYDLIYSGFKDYDAEAEKVMTLIRHEFPGAHSILDVACGTAEHARLLTEKHVFAVDGLDLDPAFVRIAQGKLPRGEVFQGDMTSFALPRTYDVILCLFSSIGYVRTIDNVERTLARFRAHLAPNGVVIVEPWFPPGVLESGRIFTTTAESAGVTVCRMSHAEVEGRLSRLHFEYLIGRAGGIERASETHELGLFTTAELLDCFRTAGLNAEHDAAGLNDRGVFVARAASRT